MTGHHETRFMFRPGVPWKLVSWGLLVWFAVALSIRTIGHVLLDPTQPLVLAGFFVVVVPLMALVTYPIYQLFHVRRRARPTAAAMMSIPGMLLDVGIVLGANVVFPSMTTRMVVNFGAILLFGYAVVLATGFYPPPKDLPDRTQA